jgi:hypothetical protein
MSKIIASKEGKTSKANQSIMGLAQTRASALGLWLSLRTEI